MESDENLLREFVQQILQERIRSKHFDLREFKSLRSPQMCIDYAEMAGLEDLFSGSSRQAYALSSGKVLKVALPENQAAGRAQNEAEVEIYTNPKTKPLVTKVYDYDSRYKWIIVELVRPLDESANEEFESQFGVDFYTMTAAGFAKSTGRDLDEILDQREIEALEKNPKARQFLQSYVNLVNLNNVGESDMSNAGHWGKTADGRIVLLDFGATEDVLAKHYGSSQ